MILNGRMVGNAHPRGWLTCSKTSADTVNLGYVINVTADPLPSVSQL